MDEKAIELHLNIIGNRETYCIFGGKQEWNEKSKLYRLPKSSRNKATEWILKDKLIDVLNEYYNKKWTLWVSLNDKETGDDTIEGVTDISVFWFDFDAPRANKAEPATDEEREQAFEEAKKFKEWMQKGFGVIGFIACSGNGYHLFYPVEPYPLLGKSFRKEVNEKQRSLFKKLREKSNINFDTTTDIRRVTQPIGGLNYKIPDNPIKTYWVDNPTGEEIEEARKKNLSLLTAVLDTKIEGETHVAIAKDHSEFSELLEQDIKLKDLYMGNWQKYNFKSRSEAEQSLVTILCLNGFSDDELKEIMKGCKIGKWQEKEESYHNATVKKGREFAASHPKIESGKSDGKLHDTDYYLITKEKRDGTEEFVGIRHKLFADDLIALHHFKTLQDTEEVIYYEDGYYHYEGEARVRAESERVFGEYINSYHVNEILNHIRRSTYINRKELNKDLWTLNLENGLFNIKSFEFTPHIPDLITTIRMPLNYDPDATCPAIEKFISEVVYSEHVTLIKEMIGYCLYHDYTYQNWFLLHGEGANGKSKMLSLIGKFLGEENISSIGLQDLNQRFAPVNLYGKSANVVADLSDADLKRTARLKQLTGGDLITAEPKFKNAFTYFNFAKLIYSCNKVPLTEDKSKAFFRRVIFIPFPNTFVIGKNADEKIIDKLTTKEELSGLLNVAIAGLKHIAGNGGFSGYLTPEENEDLYERASNPVYGFFYDCCEVDVEKYVVKMELYDAFCEYCKEMRIIAFSEKKFIQEIKLLVRLDESRISVGKQRLRVWKGICIKDVHGVHDVHLSPSPKVTVENSTIYDLEEMNHGHGGHSGQSNDYATCEQCGKEALLTEHNGICVCPDCLKNAKEEQKKTSTIETNGGHNGGRNDKNSKKKEEKPTPFVNIEDLDEKGNVKPHKKDDSEFQAKQSREARERMEKEGMID